MERFESYAKEGLSSIIPCVIFLLLFVSYVVVFQKYEILSQQEKDTRLQEFEKLSLEEKQEMRAKDREVRQERVKRRERKERREVGCLTFLFLRSHVSFK